MLKPPGQLLRMPKQQTIIQKRLLDAGDLLREGDPEITYQHTVFCQASLPYRDPGDAVRVWDREQGKIALRIRAGEVRDGNGAWVPVGLPFGPKPRLILAYLNSEALRTGSPEIEVEGSLTAFTKRIGLQPKGPNLRIIRDQLTRLSAAQISLAVAYAEDRSRQVDGRIVGGLDLWFPKDDRQRTIWPTTVRLSQEYFESLQRHAVPLDERALGFLSHSVMALDLYAWMAQRLHRIPKPHRQLVPWGSLKEQFGLGYADLYKFRQSFRQALRQVHIVYEAAKLEVTSQGLLLHTSPPPIEKTGVVVQLPAG